jgi:hypothetical protein
MPQEEEELDEEARAMANIKKRARGAAAAVDFTAALPRSPPRSGACSSSAPKAVKGGATAVLLNAGALVSKKLERPAVASKPKLSPKAAKASAVKAPAKVPAKAPGKAAGKAAAKAAAATTATTTATTKRPVVATANHNKSATAASAANRPSSTAAKARPATTAGAAVAEALALKQAAPTGARHRPTAAAGGVLDLLDRKSVV